MNIKKVFLLMVFCLGTLAYGQTQLQPKAVQPFSAVNSNSLLFTGTTFTNAKTYSFQQLNYKLLNDKPVFTINRGRVVTDSYLVKSDYSFTYLNSYVDQDNVFRGVKTDSFNPGGVSEAWQGLVVGGFNTLFSK